MNFNDSGRALGQVGGILWVVDALYLCNTCRAVNLVSSPHQNSDKQVLEGDFHQTVNKMHEKDCAGLRLK